jgi:hypothetical protein
MNPRAPCPNCGERAIPLLAKAGISARESVACPACGVHLELGPVWGWVLAVAAPTLFSVLLIVLFFALNAWWALILTLLLSTAAYLGLAYLAPLHIVAD